MISGTRARKTFWSNSDGSATTGGPGHIRIDHNFVIVKPGTKEKVGTASATMTPDKLDGQGRAYLPNSPDILAATKLVEPGQKETLKFTAPNEEGEYEYVCTIPGHFAIMNGKLIVTKDVDAWLVSHASTDAASAAK